MSIVKELLPDIADAAGKFKRKLRIKLLKIYYCAANADPSKAAMFFGGAWAFFGMITPILENNFKVEKRDFRSSVDFDKTEPTVYINAVTSIFIWEIIYATFRLSWRSVKVILGKSNRHESNKKQENINKSIQ